MVFFLGQGLLEVSGHGSSSPGRSVMIWIQVRDVHAEHARLAAAGVPVIREPAAEPWGLTEMWIEDPDGIRIVLVEVPADTEEAADGHRIGAEPYSLAIGTARRDTVEVSLRIHPSAPAADLDGAEHVVEADLGLPSGDLAIYGPTNAGFRTGSLTLGSSDFQAELASPPATPSSAVGPIQRSSR